MSLMRSDLIRRTSILRKVVVMACLVASLSVIIFATFMAAHERRNAVDVLNEDASALAQLTRSLCLREMTNENFAGAIATAQSLLSREKQLTQVDIGFISGENVEVRAEKWKSVEFEDEIEEVTTAWGEVVFAMRELVYPELERVSRSEPVIVEGNSSGKVKIYVEPLAKPSDASMLRYALTGKVGGLSLGTGRAFRVFLCAEPHATGKSIAAFRRKSGIRKARYAPGNEV